MSCLTKQILWIAYRHQRFEGRSPIVMHKYYSIEELESVINETRYMLSSFNIYRGVSDYSHCLESSLLRFVGKEAAREALIKTEEKLLRSFQETCLKFGFDPKENDVQWLMFGQHYGLPTRLLDWSKSLYIALYFCVSENQEKDGAIYLSPYSTLKDRKLEKCQMLYDLSRETDGHPELEDYYADQLEVPFFDQRVKNQKGFFTFVKDPRKQANVDVDIKKFCIPKEAKSSMLSNLEEHGINQDFVYPNDLNAKLTEIANTAKKANKKVELTSQPLRGR
jgi:FRG domain-containing protein